MARLQISVLSCYPTVTVRGKANVTVAYALSLASVSSVAWVPRWDR